ncbi:MAG: prolipoprotein diacylglyceryl transferase [Nanobdellota archaeon]
MIKHTLNPVLIDLPGPLEIRYYGIFYIIGLILGYFIIKELIKEKGIELTKEEVLDYIVYLGLGLLIGGRFFYFIFYMPWTFWQNPLQLFIIWNGGMSFHGGVAGAFIAGWWFCKKKKIKTMKLADITIIPVALGLFLGRIGNFINGELVGRMWNGTFCISYESNPYLNNPPKLCRYPSQIAEALKNLFIFSILWFLNKRKFPDGTIFWTFITLYGILRFLVEFIRAPDPQLGFFFGWITMGQLLSSIMIIFGISVLIYLQRKQ